MALKKTQNQLKKEFRQKIQKLEYAIYAKCFDCMCFQADGYYDCEMDDCPLYQYRLKQPVGKTSKSLGMYLGEIKRQIQRE